LVDRANYFTTIPEEKIAMRYVIGAGSAIGLFLPMGKLDDDFSGRPDQLTQLEALHCFPTNLNASS
jgi:hypothetical protein